MWIIKGEAKELRLPPEQLAALEAIKEGNVSPKELVDTLGKGRTAVQNLLKKLAHKGFIETSSLGSYKIVKVDDSSDTSDSYEE